jgi:hypothetical protein
MNDQKAKDSKKDSKSAGSEVATLLGLFVFLIAVFIIGSGICGYMLSSSNI